MSADLLCEAAALARSEWEGEQSGPFSGAARIHLAVADLLDQHAKVPRSITRPLVAVARAYLDAAT